MHIRTANFLMKGIATVANDALVTCLDSWINFQWAPQVGGHLGAWLPEGTVSGDGEGDNQSRQGCRGFGLAGACCAHYTVAPYFL